MTSSYTPKTGRFLISEPFMFDPNFKRTVVLLVEHGEEGSIGFVLNRRIDKTIDEIVELTTRHNAPVFLGGPVEQNTLHYIHQLGEELPGSKEILDGVFWGGDFEALNKKIASGEIGERDILFFVGYSGWGNSQLEDELERKSWIVAPGNTDFVFQENYDDLWRQILKSMGTRYGVIANYPEDPRLN